MSTDMNKKHNESKVASKAEKLEEATRATYKSMDTEEWLDKVWTRPIGFLFAKFFEKLS